MKIYKKILLTLFFTLLLLFLNNNVFAVSISYNNWEGAPQYATIEPLVLPDGTNSYITAINNDRNEIVVAVPYNTGDYIANYFSGSSYRFAGYSPSFNSLTDIKVYKATFSTDTDSWSSWTSSVHTYVTDLAVGNTDYIYKSKFNIVQYDSGIGVIGTDIISSGVPLPDDIKLTDNITIFNTYNNFYVAYSSNKDNIFTTNRYQYFMKSPSGTNTNYTVYRYDKSSNKFVVDSENITIFAGSSGGYYFIYSYNNISKDGTLLNYGCGDFFQFYYESNTYIFPYIADTDEVLSNLDNVEDILLFPGHITKSQLPMVFSIYDNTNQKQIYSTNLDINSPFYLYIVENPSDYWFEINTSEFKNSLVNGNEYLFNIYAHNDMNEFNISRSIIYGGTTYIPPTDEEIQTDAIINQTQKIEEQTNAIKDQTEKIEEQTEVNKSIFARIGEILSYINPLSENFFAYKLVGILVDALKSLFIPEERIFRHIF